MKMPPCRGVGLIFYNSDIMRDNAIICISGGGPGHCMGVDMNIEHLIGYLKVRVDICSFLTDGFGLFHRLCCKQRA
jgi:hypothetical protein